MGRELARRTCVITGGNGGIGAHVAAALMGRGLDVVLTVRDEERGAATVAALEREVPGGVVDFVVGDLSTRRGVDALARGLLKRCPRVDVLINNAGVFPTEQLRTEDGFELAFAVNVAAPYLLTHALLPSLRAAPGARVVNLTGGSTRTRIDLDDLQSQKGFRGFVAYDQSKRAADAMSLALARELEPLGVFVNIVYPGQAATAMTRAVEARHLPWWMRPLAGLMRRMSREDGGVSARRAARSTVWAATAPELAGVAGRYFDSKCRPRPLNRSIRAAASQEHVLRVIDGAAPAPDSQRRARERSATDAASKAEAQ